MIKLVFCVRRRADLSAQQFRKYWLETHGPLVRSHAAVLGIQRYVQSHTLEGTVNDQLRASRGAAAAYDGIAEVWWADRESMERTLSAKEAAAAGKALAVDEAKFIDLARSSLFLTEEHAFLGVSP